MSKYDDVTNNMRLLAELITSNEPDADDLMLAETLKQEAARRDERRYATRDSVKG